MKVSERNSERNRARHCAGVSECGILGAIGFCSILKVLESENLQRTARRKVTDSSW